MTQSLSQRVLASIYGVSKSSIRRAQKGETWSFVQ